MQYLVFVGIWIGLVVAGFLVAGFAAMSSIGRLSREPPGKLDQRRILQIHIENNTQLFVISILLAGILAVLVTTLLVK